MRRTNSPAVSFPILTGTTNLWTDPSFVAPESGNYHILYTSTARDAGIETDLDHDLDGQLRPMGQAHDIGADEYAEAGLKVQVVPSTMWVNRGSILTFTVGITNVGGLDATDVALTTTTSIWQRLLSLESPSANCAADASSWGETIYCTPGNLTPGASAEFTFAVQVSPTIPLEQAMSTTVVARAYETTNVATATTFAQDCHVRINEGTVEYTVVQNALDVAHTGDLVKVAGTCVGTATRADHRQLAYVDKTLTLQGGYSTTEWQNPDPQNKPAILDALQQGHVVYVEQDISPTIEGFTITGGAPLRSMAPFPVEQGNGGGIYVAGMYGANNQPKIQFNRITGNVAQSGGGLYLYSGSAKIKGNTVVANTAGSGGGIYLGSGSTAQLTANSILSNTAKSGGGITMWWAEPTLSNTIIADNWTEYDTGSVYIWCSRPILLHTTIARSRGPGGTGIYVTHSFYGDPSQVVMTNTILVSHTVGIWVDTGPFVDNSVHMEATLWGDGEWANETDWSGGGVIITGTPALNYWGDPAFVQPDALDYRIGADSAAIDRGVDASVTQDIEGDARPAGNGYDLGADEYVEWPRIYLPIVLRNDPE